jgi:hypothetical protein
MVIEQIKPQWYRLTFKRTGEETLLFFGYSQEEVLGKWKAHLRISK